MEIQGESTLPMELAERLEAGQRKALDHVGRRQILRALGENGRQRTAAELTRGGTPLASTSYHLSVLERSGLVVRMASEQVEGTIRGLFASSRGDRTLVLEVLQATDIADRRHSAPKPS